MKRRDALRSAIGCAALAIPGAACVAALPVLGARDETLRIVYEVSGDEEFQRAVDQMNTLTSEQLANMNAQVQVARALAWSIVMRECCDRISAFESDYLRGEVNGLSIAARTLGGYAEDHDFSVAWARETLKATGLPPIGNHGWLVDAEDHAQFSADPDGWLDSRIGVSVAVAVRAGFLSRGPKGALA